VAKEVVGGGTRRRSIQFRKLLANLRNTPQSGKEIACLPMSESNLAPVGSTSGEEPKARARGKRVVIAFLLSLVLPGLGQLYHRQPRKGLWMALLVSLLAIVVVETCILLTWWGLAASLPVPVGRRLVIPGEAAAVAWSKREPEKAFRRPRLRVAFIAGIVLLAAFFPISGQYAYFKAFRDPSDSMGPTICRGARIVADMSAYQKKPPQRGDLILLRHTASEPLFIKRVVGVAGEAVEPGPKGAILVNGQPLALPQVCGHPVRREEPQGKPSFFPVKVPEGSFFVLGDHLGASLDSRDPNLVL
jgi:signal peptidase I